MADYNVARGDRLPVVNATLAWPTDGVLPADLTDATVEFCWQLVTGGLVQKKAATVVDAEDMTVRYEWADGDTNAAGDYYAFWIVTFDDGRKLRVPNTTKQTLKIYE